MNGPQIDHGRQKEYDQRYLSQPEKLATKRERDRLYSRRRREQAKLKTVGEDPLTDSATTEEREQISAKFSRELDTSASVEAQSSTIKTSAAVAVAPSSSTITELFCASETLESGYILDAEGLQATDEDVSWATTPSLKGKFCSFMTNVLAKNDSGG